MKTTIKDMARVLGVSHSTISRALNDSPEIGEPLKQKVRALAISMDYKANAMARSLVKQKTESVGIIIPDIENPFYASVCKNLIKFFENNNYKVLLCNSDRDIITESSYIRFLQEQRVDGIIMVPADVNQEYFKRLSHSDLPIVLLDHDGESLEIDSVMSDNYAGAKEAVLHLISLGYLSIAHIAGPEHADPSLARLKGYFDAIHGSKIHPWIIPSDSTFLGGLEASRKLFKGKEMPEAIFAVNDISALAIFQYFYDKNVRIPGNLALIGFDDILIARMAPAPLTTVRQNSEDFAREAGKLLLDKMKTGYKLKNRNIRLKPELIIRESCGSGINRRGINQD